MKHAELPITDAVKSDGVLWRVPLQINRPAEALGGGEPISFGVPLPKGLVREGISGRMVNPVGAGIPVQIQPLCRWFDGSVMWALVDAHLTSKFGGEGILEIYNGERIQVSDEQVSHEIAIEKSASGLVVRTGVATFQLGSKRLHPFDQIELDANDVFCSEGSRLVLKDQKGQSHEAVCQGWTIESHGPFRATLVGLGTFPKLRGMRLIVRMSFYAGRGLVKLELTLHNPNRARHRGGLWDLGDPGSILFRDFSLKISPQTGKNSSTLRYSLERPSEWTLPVELSSTDWSMYQDSSGGENWGSENHVNREGRVPCQFRGYRARTGNKETVGQRATPTVSWQSDRGSLSLAVPEFWQQFPKAISIDQNRLRVGIFPEEWDDLHELQGGERKTHTLWMEFQPAGRTEKSKASLDWVHCPVSVRPKPEGCDDSETLPRLRIPTSTVLDNLEELLVEARDGAEGILANRETVDEYGWRNYGDIFADHEQVYYTGNLPLKSHYNNQFDMVYGFLFHFLRTGDQSWWELGDALARHVMDIDIYHTQEDKAAYNGGLFWFTDHYLHAHTSSHRTYTRKNRPPQKDYGGGPGPEHNFTTGLMLHYCLTGRPASREAVLKLANWVIQMDEGRASIFGVLDYGPTGLASGSGSFHGPARGGGNSINALLDGWRLSQEKRYLEFAESLIRRCIHPSDDIDSLELLDVERRWSYTVFLTSLAKYLDLKAESEEFDEAYAYAQASLIHYARWMLANEKPYFDQLEKLEYPTEAWAAQEFRKANVLRRAAKHAPEPLCSALSNRGEELADRAWQDLLRFPTRKYARAIAIVMTEGYLDCVFRDLKLRPVVQGDHERDYGGPQNFVSQKLRIKTQLRTPKGLVQLGMHLLNPMRWGTVLQTRKQMRSQVP